MSRLKKILYAFIILFIVLSIIVVSVVNSSYVIDKIAQKFVPEYNISYENMSGNVFTGIKIDNLRYAGELLSTNIIYSWDPLALIQKKISIDEIKIENANIEVIKTLVSSFDVDESDDNSSGSFDFDIEVDGIEITLKPFTQEGILVKHTQLSVDDVMYHSDGTIDIDNLLLDVDTNLTHLVFQGSMNEEVLEIDSLSVDSLDTIMLEGMIKHFSQKNTKLENQNNRDTLTDSNTPNDSENSLIPKRIKVKHFTGDVLPRKYENTQIKVLDITLDDLDIDLWKILKNKRDNIQVGNLEFKLDTNITSIDLKVALAHEKVMFEHLILKDIDSLALQDMFPKESNESTVTQNTKQSKEEPSIWMPKYISIDLFKTNLVPVEYQPLNITQLSLEGNDIVYDMEKRMLNKATIDLNATTNLSKLSFNGDIRKNHLEGQTSIVPNKYLFEHYQLPIREGSIGKVTVDVNASEKRIIADVYANAKHILKGKKGDFNIDIDTLDSHVVYTLDTKNLKVNSNIMMSTPYSKDVSVSNIFEMGDGISYQGEIKAAKLSGIDEQMLKALQNLSVEYKGNEHTVEAYLKAKQIKGSFVSKDMKKGSLKIETLEAFKLNEYTVLPAELNATKVTANVNIPIHFDNTTALQGKVFIDSNVVNIDADISYDKALKIEANTLLAKNSLLENLNEEVKWDALTALKIDVNMFNDKIVMKVNSKAVQSNVTYNLKRNVVVGKVELGGLVTNIKGNPDKKIKIDTKITSMKALEKSIKKLYKLEAFPPLEGGVTLSTTITNMKRTDLILHAPKIIYKADKKTKHTLSDFKATASMEDSEFVLDTYAFTYNKQKFFSTKPSNVTLEGTQITLESIWLNDMLHVTGEYNTKTQKGTLYAKASTLPIEHEYAKLTTEIDLVTTLDGNSTSVDGDIILHGGEIKYDISQKTFASDSDIIITQEMQNNKASPFMDNLSTNIQITTKEPLVLKQGPINIKLKPELGINKVKNSELMVLGSVELVKGSTYIFEGKKFVLAKSAIHFTGNPNKPLLEIKAKYKSINHLITIHISGTPDTPNINFSSSPSLTKEQILSVILFDTEVGGDAHSGDEMMKMMGGAMAKSALSDIGVKLDHLVLGEGNSVEVGKKLTNKITIIYVNDEVSRVKLKYQHGKRTESVIQMNEESQSYDIIFKDDF